MGKKRENVNEGIITPVPKEGVLNLSERVKMEMNDTAPQHKNGEVIECSPTLAAKIEANGWGRVLSLVVLFVALSFGAVAQNLMYQAILTPGTGAKIYSDTVTNTGTSYLTSFPQTRTQAQTTAFQVNVTKISGTVGGVITLQGSLDGTNFKAIPTVDTQTSITTVTAADASAVYVWRIVGCPFTYYRVSWTGTGTMAASFTARLIAK